MRARPRLSASRYHLAVIETRPAHLPSVHTSARSPKPSSRRACAQASLSSSHLAPDCWTTRPLPFSRSIR